MGLGATLAGAATAGLTGAVTGGIGSIVSGGLGLLGGLFKRNNNGLKNQQKLMQQAWEYEKEVDMNFRTWIRDNCFTYGYVPCVVFSGGIVTGKQIGRAHV